MKLKVERAVTAIFCVLLFVLLVPLQATVQAGPQEPDSTAPGVYGRLVDGVVAVVEDKPIFESDLELDVKQFLMQMQRKSVSDEEMREIRKQVLDGMISDILMSIHAEKVGIEVRDEDVDAAVERAIEDSKKSLGGEEAFKKQLELEGFTMTQLRGMYRERLRARMLIERLMYRDLVNRVEVTDREVREYYDAHLDELPKRPATVSLAQILIIPKASREAREKALERIRMVEERIRAGADFAEMAKEYSEGPSAKYGGNLGYVNLDDLNNPAFEEAVKNLKVGEVSGPVLTEFGYHLIKLEDISDGKYLIRHILIKVESSDEDRARAAELADSLRTAVINGADFAELAAKYSDDSGSRDKGGVVGEVPLENLPKDFVDMIKDVAPGEVAPVIEDKKGFRIIKVLGRNSERVYSFEESRDELRKLIKQQKLKKKYDNYIAKLKRLYHVEVKEKF